MPRISAAFLLQGQRRRPSKAGWSVCTSAAWVAWSATAGACLAAADSLSH